MDNLNFGGSPDKPDKLIKGGVPSFIPMNCSGVITPSAVHGATVLPAVVAAALMMKDQQEKNIGKEENGTVFDALNSDKAKN